MWAIGSTSELVEVPGGRVGREIAIIDVWLLGRNEDEKRFGRRGRETIGIDRLGDGTVEYDRLMIPAFAHPI